MKAIDLTGQRFGKLVALKAIGVNKYSLMQWECLCDCGKLAIGTTSSLRAVNGGKKSCGCAAFHDLTGQRFGMLLVVNRAKNRGVKVSWLCQCDCGKTSESTTFNLINGKSASCGCVRTKHMGKGTRLFRIWGGIKTRCLNSNDHAWPRYGGRGIKIFDEWKNDFAAFKSWSLSNGYEEGLTIDRIDNDGGYYPENCQWITKSENSKKGKSSMNRCENVA